jgi:prephenate dehydratase
MNSPSSIAFLGPEGTFAHLAANQRFGNKFALVPQRSVADVFDYVRQDESRYGIVPIENSSGGTILDTVDRLVDASYDLFIQESLSINVKLALLGKDKKNIRTIYSHFAPLHHCETWLRKNFPDAEKIETQSTTMAVIAASKEAGAAAIGTRLAGEIYKLKVLEFPIEQDIPNVTQFLILGHTRPDARAGSQTSLVVELPNKVGSLYKFLGPFLKQGINLSRLLSRPLSGHPGSHLFLVDAETTETDPKMQRALKAARKHVVGIRSIGSYPVRKRYDS